MRIGLVSTCALSTPPRGYGGTELVVAELAHGLTELGEDVVVYATGDSTPRARLRFLERTAVWPPSPEAEDRHARFALEDLSRCDVDVVHVNDPAALPHLGRVAVPCVVTLHHKRDDDAIESYRRCPSAALVAISQRQADLHGELEFAAVIHHGLDPARYPMGSGDGGYAAFLGRLAPEKAPHEAIDAAVRANVPLWIGGDAQEVSRDYFESVVAPRLLRHTTLVRWLGELTHEPKLHMLRGASALLMPVRWEEPFGLVMIEAMLVGTPVLAYPRGSVCEIVEEGVTGFVVRDVGEMAVRLREVERFDRTRCRARAVERFSHMRMARDHLDLYRSLVVRAGRRSRFSWMSSRGERHAERA